MITKVRISFNKLKAETSKAVLLDIMGEEYWMPKKMCWNFVTNKKLGGHCEIPAWLYQEKFGALPEEKDASEIIEKHVPKRIIPTSSRPDADLTR